jgi:hypothetical protein
MSDESIESAGKRSISRRTALKAGVAGGVGLAAWSGATITSLGGTPAYAISSTQLVTLDITAGCRNIDNSSTAPFRYHQTPPVLPSGFMITTVAEGTDCGVADAVLTWDNTRPNITCSLILNFFDPGCTTVICTSGCITSAPGGLNGGTLSLPLSCYCQTPPPPIVGPSSKWTLTGACVTNGGTPHC